ncbi:hypothetical protein [Mycobacterium sp. E1747]|uniref:hypothetical protein n=1 Tax=Mycobacterium sp. E1747 TaxID=1834128 RepID=UPI000A817EFB|nr:hypothetical protein [Mycobacterium sp. E1747]
MHPEREGQRAVPPNRHRLPLNAAIAGCAALLAACGGSNQTATTVTSTVPAETKTVTVTAAPPPPPGPKTTIASDGTFIIGSDIAAGTYRSAGKYGCYWARLRSLDTTDIIDNNVNDGPQVVQILPSDRAFMTRNCAAWHKAD